MEIYYMYTKKAFEFGRQPFFQDEAAQVIVDNGPEKKPRVHLVPESTWSTETQVGPAFSEHEVNTHAKTYTSQGMCHTEGGWPKDIDSREVEHTIRYRKKIEKDEEYVRSIMGLGDKIEDLIRQNNAIDVYEDYFGGPITDHSSEPSYGKTITVFRDVAEAKRSPAYLSWHPDGARKVAVAYATLEFQGRQREAVSSTSYIWDVNNPNFPEQALNPSSYLFSLLYNPKDSNILVGGQYNGQITYWDTRKGPTAVDTSPIEKSHKDPVYDVCWLQSKTGTECMTTSTDGLVYWWDIRRLGEPVDELELTGPSEYGTLGGVSLEYQASVGPSKFMVGTEQGMVLNCNRKTKTPSERVSDIYCGHHAPVYGLARHSFFPKYFLSIGDWTSRIWSEDLKTPIMMTKYHSNCLVGGSWSPVRPGVFFLTKMDGTVDVWDYLFKQNEPVLTLQISDARLTSFRAQEAGRFLAVGAADGSTSLIELCEGLSVIQTNEKQAINQIFERETKREKNLEERARDPLQKASSQTLKFDEMDELDEEEIKKIEQQFHMAIQGLSEGPADDDTGDSGDAEVARDTKDAEECGDEA